MTKGYFVALLCKACSLFLYVAGNELSNFIQFPGGIVGCDFEQLPESGTNTCATTCFDDSACTAVQFLENPHTCMVCDRNKVSNFQKENGTVFYLVRNERLRNLPLSSSARTEVTDLKLKQSYLPGAVIHVSFTMLEGARMKVGIQDCNDNIAFIMQFGRKVAGDSNKIVFGCRINQEWRTKRVLNHPIEVGREYEVYILITSSQFVIWIDNVHLTAVNLQVPLGNLLFVRVNGYGQVHELSV